MLRVCICCGGGFSSSVLMCKVKSELVEKGYDDKLKIGFCPFKEVYEHYDEYDVVMAFVHIFHISLTIILRSMVIKFLSM